MISNVLLLPLLFVSFLTSTGTTGRQAPGLLHSAARLTQATPQVTCAVTEPNGQTPQANSRRLATTGMEGCGPCFGLRAPWCSSRVAPGLYGGWLAPDEVPVVAPGSGSDED